MNKKIKIAIIVIVVVIVVYYAYGKYKAWAAADQAKKDALADPKTPGTNNVSTPSVNNDTFPLSIGAKGPNVKSIQTAINRIKPEANLVADGSFGQQTYEALITYVGTRYYPVTQQNFIDVLRISNTK